MTPAEYERFRQQLEAQLRCDIELIYEAYRTKLRAYETVLRARGELEGRAWEPPAALSLPAAGLPALPEVAAAAPSDKAAAPPAAKPRKKAAPPNDVYNDLLDLLEQERVGEPFTKKDLAVALGYEPARSTLHRALQDLERSGEISAVEYGIGRAVTLYRKGPRPTAADSAGEPQAKP